jgi:hypothetical protein
LSPAFIVKLTGLNANDSIVIDALAAVISAVVAADVVSVVIAVVVSAVVTAAVVAGVLTITFLHPAKGIVTINAIIATTATIAMSYFLFICCLPYSY